jgi:hypothetical protein
LLALSRLDPASDLLEIAMVLLITYDLHKPERDYDDVTSEIKSFGSWAHPEESVWLVDTTLGPQDCRNRLKQVTEDATYFIVWLQHNWSSYKLTSPVVKWLKDPGRSW